MLSEEILKIFKRQHYAIAESNSALQICLWTKKSLLNKDFCYKEKFYGIKSHLCCQMSPSALFCQNKCIHCWRAIEYTLGDKMNEREIDNPEKIYQFCILQQRKMLSGFKGNKKINMKKFKEAQEPRQFAISLIGEPTIYPKLADFIKLLRKQRKTSFLVTNGLLPERLRQLQKEDALPTQLYISLNAADKKNYDKWHHSSLKDAWKKFNQSLELMKKLDTRRVIRMTLVKDLNMQDEMTGNYAKLIKKTNCDFIEIKGFVSVGFARKRLGYEKMPTHQEIIEFAKKLLKFLPKYKFLDEKFESKVILLGQNREKMKIKRGER